MDERRDAREPGGFARTVRGLWSRARVAGRRAAEAASSAGEAVSRYWLRLSEGTGGRRAASFFEFLMRRRRRVYFLGGIFLGLSLFVCLASYFGWFGWFAWGRPKKPLAPVVAEGDDAMEFVARLLKTEAQYSREDVKKLRVAVARMTIAKDSRHRKYSQEFTYKVKRPPEPLETLDVARPTLEQAKAMDRNEALDELGLVELYGIACHLDRRMHDVYRLFRTCELARIQRLSLLEAYEATKVVAPEHRPADLGVLRARIRTTAGDEMKRFREEVSRIKTEIKAMVAASTRMIDLAAIIEPGILGFGSEWEMAAMGDDALYRTQALIERPPNLFEGQTGFTPGAFEHEWGRGEGPITKKDLGLPIDLGIDLSKSMPLPGRKLMKKGRGSEWMFINAWYVMGPFPNPGRQNLQKRFPPETSIDPEQGFVGIDLDTSYIGMGNAPVRWEFLATDRRVCFIPHRPADWAIWYAYTEIWSEVEQDRFCIFGSDDYGQCWIDAKLVFTSGVTPHPWVPDRAYAKVQFRRGFNPVLFKLENAWGRTGFSLCVYTGKLTGGSKEGGG